MSIKSTTYPFCEALERDGDLVRVTQEIDPILDAAAITRIVYENDGPAALLENVKGAKNGLFHILGAPNRLRKNPKMRTFGDVVDLLSLPSPLIHQQDGGKYIHTNGMHVVQFPDGRWTNWSIARAMISDKRHLVGLVIESQHIWQIYQLWKKEGKKCKWAQCLGVPPAGIMAASMPIR
ncbi:hypothetical protein NliqN6_5918 [Naganishia liquefaciens]|uniref:Uncharacterized protein n=1 Tax=Naganishia liquefaciens TaxID=104408 RepID=A0A8H3YJG9_9TREE|nr:hypothetical protein NliqN6_5918 [Naganishia liquefaciens]